MMTIRSSFTPEHSFSSDDWWYIDGKQVVVVSEKFEGKSLLTRHRMVNELFAAEMKSNAVHGENMRARSLFVTVR